MNRIQVFAEGKCFDYHGENIMNEWSKY